MNEQLGQLDTELKELFVGNKIEEMDLLLQFKSDADMKELSDYNWNIIKKYYDKLTADQIKTFDELATNVYFLEITEKPVAYKEDLISKILGGALSGMVLAAIVLAVRSIRNRRKKKNEYRW
jgi:hypothetical protein